MAHQTEDSRIHGQALEVRILQSLLEPHQLLDELEVWVGAGPSVLDALVALVIRDTLCKDHICDDHRGRARDSLHAVHVKFASLAAAIIKELDRVVEAARNVLARVVLQVVALVDHALVFMVVFAVVGGAVNHVRDANVFEDFRVFGDEITTQIQEVIDDLRADSLVKLVFVLFARGSPIVEILIVQLFGCNLVLLHPVGSGLARARVHHATVPVALTLSLTAWCAKLVLLVPLAAPAHLMIWRLRGPSVTRTAIILVVVSRISLNLCEVQPAHMLSGRLPRMLLLLLRHRQMLLLQLLRLPQVQEAKLGLVTSSSWASNSEARGLHPS